MLMFEMKSIIDFFPPFIIQLNVSSTYFHFLLLILLQKNLNLLSLSPPQNQWKKYEHNLSIISKASFSFLFVLFLLLFYSVQRSINFQLRFKSFKKKFQLIPSSSFFHIYSISKKCRVSYKTSPTVR